MKEYWFVIWENKYSLSNEKDLALLLRLFSGDKKMSSIIHWNILMEVDNDLENIIKSYKWLLVCLRYLNEKNSFLLLVKIWNILINLINDSSELSELLSRIPEDSNKMRLLSILRVKWLSKVLFDARDLWNIIQWLYWNSEREFLDLLWDDFIKWLFLSTNEIIMILNYVDDVNKDYIINIIWFWWVKNKIKTTQNLLIMYSWLSMKKAQELLNKYDKTELLSFFRNNKDFHDFLLRLSQEKEELFLNYLQK